MPFLIKEAFEQGLVYVKQLVSTEGEMIDYETAHNMFGLSVMDYNSLITAIPMCWRKTFMKTGGIIDEKHLYDEALKQTKTSAYAYRMLNQKPHVLREACIKFNKKTTLNIYFEEFANSLVSVKGLTKNAKLKSFQFRFLHSAIILNPQLHKWKMLQTNECTYCANSTETYAHFFWECSYAQKVWKWVDEYVDSIDNGDKYERNIVSVCLLTVNESCNHIYNFLILIAKQYMYASRCQKKAYNKFEFLQRIRRIRSYELYQAKMTNTLNKFCVKWLVPKNDLLYEIIHEYNEM